MRIPLRGRSLAKRALIELRTGMYRLAHSILRRPLSAKAMFLTSCRTMILAPRKSGRYDSIKPAPVQILQNPARSHTLEKIPPGRKAPAWSGKEDAHGRNLWLRGIRSHPLHLPANDPAAPDDGALDDECWVRAERSPRFIDLVTGAPAPLETRMAALWDDKALYVAYWIEEPNVQARLTERDSFIWTENDVEMFIGGPDCYYEFPDQRPGNGL